MAKQITINQSFYKKMGQLQNQVREKVWTKGEEVVSYAVAISPVYSGAFVESFSVVPRGSGGGRSRSSEGRPIVADKAGKKQEEAARLRADVRAIDPLEAMVSLFVTVRHMLMLLKQNMQCSSELKIGLDNGISI